MLGGEPYGVKIANTLRGVIKAVEACLDDFVGFGGPKGRGWGCCELADVKARREMRMKEVRRWKCGIV